MGESKFGRRDFVSRGLQAGTGITFLGLCEIPQAGRTFPSPDSPKQRHSNSAHPYQRAFNGVYEHPFTDHIAFPLGGMGAGMMCLEGTGALSGFSLHHWPEFEREHRVFSALSIANSPELARVLEGPVATWKLTPQFPGNDLNSCWGLPRFRSATFEAQFPFGKVSLDDEDVPLTASLCGWSPFIPGDADSASLPVATLEYRFENRTAAVLDAAFSFNSENILTETQEQAKSPGSARLDRIRAIPGGFVLCNPGNPDQPWTEGYLAAWVSDPNVRVNHAWALDRQRYLSLSHLWRQFAAGTYEARPALENEPARGASIFVPFKLAPGEVKVVTLHFAWYAPHSNLFEPQNAFKDGRQIACPPPSQNYRSWYAARFSGINDVVEYWQRNYESLKNGTQLFSSTLQDSTLPPEIIESVVANLSILKSTTVLRQFDGRLWGWEGTYGGAPDLDRTGISGTSTHVWNYAQAIPHLFPALERGLRETELNINQNDKGLQYCRTPLPIRAVEPGHLFPDGPAADGQLGGIIKVFREWRISGNTEWLHGLWPKVRASLEYCIKTWDPGHQGWLSEPHVTTYDMEFWGPNSFTNSLYLGALQAATSMADAVNDPVELYRTLLNRAIRRIENDLFNGEFFFQNIDWKSTRTAFTPDAGPWAELYGKSADWTALLQTEGPSGQYGTGCLSDGLMGTWLAAMSGIDPLLDSHKVESHLLSVYRYNFKRDLKANANFMRVSFGYSGESGLLLCSWPLGGRPTIPLLYSDEVWTGIEYQVASHLIIAGRVEEGLDVIRAIRSRYDGRVRNPFDEVEAGHWYARAMSSYALLQAYTGARFDAIDKTLYLRPAVEGDFRTFLATETGFGTVGVRNGQPFVEVVSGLIPYRKIDYKPYSRKSA